MYHYSNIFMIKLIIALSTFFSLRWCLQMFCYAFSLIKKHNIWEAVTTIIEVIVIFDKKGQLSQQLQIMPLLLINRRIIAVLHSCLPQFLQINSKLGTCLINCNRNELLQKSFWLHCPLHIRKSFHRPFSMTPISSCVYKESALLSSHHVL